MLRVFRVASLVLLAAFISSGVASGPADGPGFTADSSVAARLRPGMVFSEQGLTVSVPPRGMSVAVEAISGKGKAVEIGLETRNDGSVVVHRGDTMRRVARFGGSMPLACGDGAYMLNGARWTKPYVWYMSSSNLPSNLSISGTEAVFKESVGNIVRAHNNCGRGDQVAATSSYAGRTKSSPDITENAACTWGDGRSELGFKRLTTNYLAYSCRWWSGNEFDEADSVYNTNYKWYTKKPDSCWWRWSVENVATHELGHTFGLSHVEEASHARLTMSPNIFPCSNRESSLGLGDLKGLESLY